ncbi:hypothetical protein HYU14_06445 [Candidatus Woesearchaeota archaeon]|nr:hypothetical protein [Candidatus Woesearchaeota archaeon]
MAVATAAPQETLLHPFPQLGKYGQSSPDLATLTLSSYQMLMRNIPLESWSNVPTQEMFSTAARESIARIQSAGLQGNPPIPGEEGRTLELLSYMWEQYQCVPLFGGIKSDLLYEGLKARFKMPDMPRRDLLQTLSNAVSEVDGSAVQPEGSIERVERIVSKVEWFLKHRYGLVRPIPSSGKEKGNEEVRHVTLGTHTFEIDFLGIYDRVVQLAHVPPDYQKVRTATLKALKTPISLAMGQTVNGYIVTRVLREIRN